MRSTFTSRPGPLTAAEKALGKRRTYSGPERRWQGERRNKMDRRQAVRWEPGKEDRRCGVDRRRAGGPADPWSANGRIF